ncbi:MAG: copper resistance protein CopC [Pseudomonadota bacterium]
MKLRLFALSLLMTVSAIASAHARLTASSPAEKSQVTAPEKLALTFTDSVVLTALTLQRGKEAVKKLGLPPQADYGFNIPLPALAPGDYAVNWRVVSDDTHVSSGTIHFTVVGAKPNPPAH